MSDDEQGIVNGVKHYSVVAVRSVAATAKMIIAAGGDPVKAVDTAALLSEKSICELIDSQMRNKNAAELTEHLAACPPIDFVSDDDYADELEADLVQ